MDVQAFSCPPLPSLEPVLLLDSDPVRPSCIHHWVLGGPDHGVIDGRCKRCGITRAFAGTRDETFRFDDFRELTQSSTYFERSRPNK